VWISLWMTQDGTCKSAVFLHFLVGLVES
jgi:hypothetical protein